LELPVIELRRHGIRYWRARTRAVFDIEQKPFPAFLSCFSTDGMKQRH
jgi:hypothetical protein